MKTKYIPFKKMHRSLSTFAEEYCGLVRGEEPDSYGFYRNPDTRWDWFQIGGRWPDRFLVKADCPVVHTGEVSLLMQDYQGREAPEGYCWVAGARKKDIAWDVMREQRARAETEYFHKLESWYQNGQIPDDRRWFLSITDEGIRSWNALAYADQLPSVGPGAVLNELLACGQLPAVILDKVFRQSEGSLVAENAQRIRHGVTDLEFGDDFQFWPSAEETQSAQYLMWFYKREVDRYGVDNVALLTPFRKKSKTGVYSLNAALHDTINPASQEKDEIETGQRILRVGDKVMQMKNRDFASNGDIGYICTSKRDSDGILVEVDFGDDRVVAYEDAESLRQLELAYAATIHKSQGSEYDAVLINIQNMHGKMLNRALIYTAETRAKKQVIIVGDWEAVVRAIQTADTKRRNTMLAVRINDLTKE